MLLLIVHQKNTPGKNTSIIRRACTTEAFKKKLVKQQTNKIMERSNIRMKYDAKNRKGKKGN